ncbi:MAG TPA: folate-binding protein [Terricaulis sp.]|nr:folate-binding protein [Terricaulis sp.]
MPFRLDRALIRVSGPDAVSFLDNLLTQDVTKLANARVQYAALLSPQGKLIADMFLWFDAGDGVIIELDPTRKDDLLRRLTLYKLRAQATIEEITGQFHVLYSPDFFRGGTEDPRFRGGELGWREVCPLPPEQNAFEPGDAAYDAHRLALGVPDLARDAAPEEVFAGEALLEELNGVDFHKGCFVGQENTSRMKRRATTRKKFCPVVFDGPAPAYGAVIKAGEAEIGQVRTGAEGRAMALIRLDRALAAERLTAEGRDLRLDPPPWLILPQREGDQD